MSNSRRGAIRWQINDFLSDVNSNVCSMSHRLRHIRKRIKNAQTLTLKINMKVNE